MATVLTGLQTWAKVLQMHLSETGGTPWMQPKSNVTFKLASLDILKFLAIDCGVFYFHYSGHSAHKVVNLCKIAAHAPFRGWGETLVATQK